MHHMQYKKQVFSGTFQFFAQFIKKLLDTLELSDIIPPFEKLNHSNEANYRTVSALPEN